MFFMCTVKLEGLFGGSRPSVEVVGRHRPSVEVAEWDRPSEDDAGAERPSEVGVVTVVLPAKTSFWGTKG